MVITPIRSLNRSFLRNQETKETKDKFRLALLSLLSKLDDKEDEEYNKTLIHDFLTHTFYDEPYLVNTRKKVDQAIYGPGSLKPWVLMEMKSPDNISEMPSEGHFDRKGFSQLVLYYMKE